MTMFQTKYKIEETKYPSLTIVYKITCSPTTNVNCPITEAWYVTFGFTVQLQA